MKRQPKYLPEFRRQLVDLVKAGRSPVELSKEFGPTAHSIRSWVRSAEGKASSGSDLTLTEQEELHRLRREVQQLRIEREILAKATAWFARETNGGSGTFTDS